MHRDLHQKTHLFCHMTLFFIDPENNPSYDLKKIFKHLSLLSTLLIQQQQKWYDKNLSYNNRCRKRMQMLN